MGDFLSDACFERLNAFGDGILDYLYNDYLHQEYASVSTFDDTAEFIEAAMRDWYRAQK